MEFEFNQPIRTKKDLDELPPGTILATGLSRDVFQALEILHLPAHGFLGQRLRGDLTRTPPVIVYMDRHTWDYGFFSHVNGTGGALLFQRGKPLTARSRSWFVDALAQEGLEFGSWHDVDLACLPTVSFRNPRLFHGKFILAGSLSGALDPLLLFGVHGTLVTGKIAALATREPAKALREFRRINFFWRWSLLHRKLVERTHPWGTFLASRASLELYPLYSRNLLKYLFITVPGWLRV